MTSVEYALIAGLIALVAGYAASAVGIELNLVLLDVVQGLGGGERIVE